MSDPVANAYREMAELLTTLRRIVGRWVERNHGEGSFEAACSASVAERLLARRRSETKLSQVPPTAEALLEYTDFTDLAELLLDELELLDRLVPRLASSPQELLRQLEQMEVVRLQLARAKPVSPKEVEAVGRLHDRLLGALRSSGRPQAGAVDVGSETEAVQTEELAAPAPVGAEADGTTPEAAREPASAVQAADQSDAEAENSETFGVEVALEQGDEGGVVRALHREVTLLADEAICGSIRHRPAVWTLLERGGWSESNLGTLGLEPVARFYEVLDELRVQADSGANGGEMRRIREELGFTDLLLEMREAFLRLR